jgi:hypothetical protein
VPGFNKILLITISVSNAPKIIGIYQNLSFIEPKIVIKKKLLQELKIIIENASKPLNFKMEKEYLQYLNEIDMKNLTKYKKAIKDFYKYEKN